MLESPGDSARGTSVGSPVSEFSASAPSPVPGAVSPVVLQPDVQARAEGHERPPHKPAAMPNLEPPLVEEPEQAAQALLQLNSPPSLAQVLDMCEHLPWESPHVDGTPQGRAFYSGGKNKGGVFGLRKSCLAFPRVVRVLTSLIRQAVPHLPFTSLAILDQVQSGPHRDLLNSSSPNVVIPLTSFEGGGIWIEDQSGATTRIVHGKPLSGNVCDFSLGHVLVPARTCYHQTEPWSGRRVVLVGYCLDNKFSAQDAEHLRSLGFPLPQEVGQAVVACSSPPEAPVSLTRAPVFLELCAGSAILSSCFREAGWDIVAVDNKHNRFHTLAKVCTLDLSLDSSWEYLRWICQEFPVRWVHAAPPCGTSSRARERPGGPPPLRDSYTPWGKPALSGLSAARVQAANILYLALHNFLQFLDAHNIHWSVENPANSVLWELEPYQELIISHHKVDMQTCAFGGPRPTWKAFVTSLAAFRALGLRCPGNHEHLSYGRKRLPSGQTHFATSEEAVYPRELCRQMVQLVSRELHIPLLELQTAPSQAHLFAAAAGRQARGHRRPLVLSEFQSVFTQDCPQLPPVDIKRRVLPNDLGLQPGIKLLSYSLKGAGDDKSFECRFGVYRSKEAFLQDALRAPHPFFDVLPLSDSSKRVLFNLLTKGPAWVADFRARTLKRWSSWARDLHSEETDLHKTLDPKVRAVLKGKRLCLWRKIAQEISWPDMALFDQVADGFSLIGHRPASGVFPLEMRPAEMTPVQLMQRSGFLRATTLQKVTSAPPCPDAAELRRITLKEVEAGSLEGPLTPEEVSCRFPDGWIPVRRFGVWQGSGDKSKLRPVDDFAEAEVNSAFAYVDKLDLRSVDTLAAMLRWWTEHCISTGPVTMCLSDGSRLEGKVHPAWKDPKQRAPLLSTMDLRNAYKQLPLSPESRRFAICVLPGARGGVECFESQALPFGSTASVVDFNRFARFLHRVGEHLCLAWVNYFDDFPVWSPAALSKSSDLTLRALVDLLGVDCAWEKMPPFSPVCPMLGIVLDASDLYGQGLLIRNKPGRAEEVGSLIRSCLEAGSIESRDLLKMLGRVQFADSHVMGRAGKLALADVRNWSKRHEVRVPITRALADAFEVLLKRITSGAPRCVPCRPGQQPVLVFTDGASEARLNTVGGLLVRPGGCRPRFFACHVDDGLVQAWAESMKHHIGPVECYAVAVARLVWHQYLAQEPCLHFIDNVACQDAFIKGTSCSGAVRSILLAYEKCELQDATWTWFARVASDSNPSDEPSRGFFGGILKSLDAQRDSCFCPVSGGKLHEILGPID